MDKAEEEAAAPMVVGGSEEQESRRAWHSYLSEDLSRSLKDSTESAVRSARSLQHNSSITFRTLQDLIPEMKVKLDDYEHAFFTKIKDGLTMGREHPAMVAGLTLSSAFLFLRGPRRFLLRHTVGRLQTEEARFVRAEKNVKMLNISVDLMKKESRKLLERTTFAEKEMTNGRTELMNAGNQMQRLAKSFNNVESQATDLMDLLRELPGREALRLRAEVASVTSHLKQQRSSLEKKMVKLSGLGVPI